VNPTRRGKVAIFVAILLVLSGVGVAALAITGHAPAPIQAAFDRATGTSHAAPPPACPLTGTPAPNGAIPARPALAIKVENAPEARPQTGLDRADIVFEEPVEGGLTRFIAVYQCYDANKVGPVRSGRTEDPLVLQQFGSPVMGFAGGANPVKKAIDRSPVIDENYLVASKAYTRDPSRLAPHNLYTTTKALWKAGKKDAKGSAWTAPSPIFTYASTIAQKSRRVGTVHLPFSGYSDVYWKWSAKDRTWERSHGDVPHTLTDGQQVAATNVVVMSVKVKTGSIVDAAGNPSPVVSLTGSGRAYVFRGGRMIVGRWNRPTADDVTTFTAKDGTTIALAPGTTWVELLPASIRVDASR
jgi:Protein of unknown function (DUF3048) N-terminal domain/Protein of unknown function (DUF3048) C-terminal domain